MQRQSFASVAPSAGLKAQADDRAGLASLLVARRTVLNEMRSIENVVRAILREAGIKLGMPCRAAFAGRVRELAGADAAVMAIVEPLLAILATMLSEFVRLTKQVLDIVRKERSLPPADERAWRRADHRARLPRHDRSAGRGSADLGMWARIWA